MSQPHNWMFIDKRLAVIGVHKSAWHSAPETYNYSLSLVTIGYVTVARRTRTKCYARMLYLRTYTSIVLGFSRKRVNCWYSRMLRRITYLSQEWKMWKDHRNGCDSCHIIAHTRIHKYICFRSVFILSDIFTGHILLRHPRKGNMLEDICTWTPIQAYILHVIRFKKQFKLKKILLRGCRNLRTRTDYHYVKILDFQSSFDRWCIHNGNPLYSWEFHTLF